MIMLWCNAKGCVDLVGSRSLEHGREGLGFSGSQVFCEFHTEQWRPGEICLTLTHLCPDVSEGMREVGTTQTLTRSQFMTCNSLPDAGPASGCPFSQEDLSELLSQSWHAL